MKFAATLTLLPFVLGAGEDRIRFGRSMHKRSRKLTAVPIDAAVAPDAVVVVDQLPSVPSGHDAAMASNTVADIDKSTKIFVHDEQRKLKSPMFSDRLLQLLMSNDSPEETMSLHFFDSSMSMDFFSMATTESETTTSTTIVPPTDDSTGTPPTGASTPAPPTDASTVTPPTDVTTVAPVTTETPSTTPSAAATATTTTTNTTEPTEPVSEQHFGNMIVSSSKICLIAFSDRTHAHVVAILLSLV